MRCPDCNKFVSYDEPQVEIQSVDIDGEGATVHVEVTVTLPCTDCNTELKSASIEAEASFEHTCKPKAERPPEQKPSPDYKDDDDQFEADDSGEAQGTSRLETKDRHGKQIKLARYMKTFYGFELDAEVKCLKCGEVFVVRLEGEEQASSFDEC
jgi:phage FluMu protein Com